MFSESLLFVIAPTCVLAVQGTLSLLDEALFHRWRVLGRTESWSHVFDTGFFALTISMPAFLTPTKTRLALFVLGALISSVGITKDNWIHERECSPGEQWIHSLLFVLHPLVLATLAWLWLEQKNPELRGACFLGALAGVTYQFTYWIGLGHAEQRPPARVNNAFYAHLGERWIHGDDHVQGLLRLQAPARVGYIRSVLVRHQVSSNARILDLGCGAGLIAGPLAAQGFDVVGVDACAEAVEAARKHATGPSYAVADAHELREADQSCDVVLALGLLERVERPQRVLLEAARVLKPGGVLIVQTVNRTWLAWLFVLHGVRLLARNVPESFRLYRYFIKPNELELQAARAGLTCSEMRGIRLRVLSRAFLSSLFDNRLNRDLSYFVGRSKALGYLGYFVKEAPRTTRPVAIQQISFATAHAGEP